MTEALPGSVIEGTERLNSPRRSVQDVEDGEFKVIETTPAKGKDAA